MRKIAPLCAVALSFALTPPASSQFFAKPASTDWADYRFVEIPATAPEADKKGLADGMNAACPEGLIAANKDDLDPVLIRVVRPHANIQLYCLPHDGKPPRELNRNLNDKGVYAILLYKGLEQEHYKLVYNGPKDKAWVPIADPAPFTPSTPKPAAEAKPAVQPTAQKETVASKPNPVVEKSTAAPSVDAAPTPAPRKMKFTPEELNYLTANERAAYDTQANDEARADFVAEHQKAVDERKAMTAPTKRDEFDRLTAHQKEKFCEPYLAGGGSGAATTEVKTAKEQLVKASGGDAQANGQIDGNTATGDVGSAPKSTGKKPADGKDDLKKACAEFAAAGPRQRSSATDTSGVEKTPSCSKKPGDHSKAAPGDADGCKDKEKTDLTQFYGDLSNGISFGLAGLVIGSFFGGPMVFAAFALVAGVSAYYLSKKINTKDDKK
ncbi:MAG: hypothetical protein ACHQ2Z_10460 [Elusimicrobiota bacterium]